MPSGAASAAVPAPAAMSTAPASIRRRSVTTAGAPAVVAHLARAGELDAVGELGAMAPT